MRIRRLVPLLLGLFFSLFLFPRVALACPMCKDAVGSDTGLAAGYSWSVVLLAFLPFVLVAVVAGQALRTLGPESYAAMTERLRAFLWRRGWLYLPGAVLGLAVATYAITPRSVSGDLRAARSALAGDTSLNRSAVISWPQLENKVVVVTFFASWCGPCREQVADVGQLRRDFTPAELAVVAVNAFEDYKVPHTHADGTMHFHSPSGLAGDLPSFLRAVEPGLVVVVNTPEISTAFGGITRIPTTLIFDRDGRLVKRYVNAPAGDFMKPSLEALRQDIERAIACGRYPLGLLRAACSR